MEGSRSLKIATGRAMRFACALALGAMSVVSGCSNPKVPPLPEARWIPSAQPSFATIARSTTYALVYEDSSDLIIIERKVLNERGDFALGTLTWLVPLPKNPRFDSPMQVGGPGSEAWVLEALSLNQTHAAPAMGSVTVHAMTADSITVSLNMTASAHDQTAGVVQQPTIELDGRFMCARYVPRTPQYQEMKTRRGVDPGTEKKVP